MAATAERLILDPTEVLATRTTLDISDWIDFEGADYGEAAIDAFMADRDRGSIPVDYRVPNREIEIPLNLVSRGGTSALTARANIQAKAALFQKEGGVLKRLTNSGGTVYADILNASFAATSVSGMESGASVDLDASLHLEVLPDWYEQERTLSDHTETTNAELIITETSIAGDYPARCRIVFDDDQGQDQRGLIWGFRSRHYSSASTAALKYEAEALQALDTATKPALTGASGGTVVTHGTLSTNWTPVLGTNIAGTQYLTHTGTYRLWARVYSTSGTTVQARAVYDVGDLVNPAENDQWRLPGASNFYDHDFGELRLDASPVGTHRWQGQIQAKGDAGGENFSVDKIWLAPVDEGYGVLTSPVPAVQGLANYSARSEFTTEAGAITGDSLAVGGTWGGAGDADDFTVAAGVATRTALSDTAGIQNGRLITASATTAMTATSVGIDFTNTLAPSANVSNQGVLARYTDANNFLACVDEGLDATQRRIIVRKRVASVNTDIASFTVPGYTSSATRSVRLEVTSSGIFRVFFGLQGQLSYMGGGLDTVLATGGTLASGKVGIVDLYVSASAATRTYGNFSAWVPVSDAVTFASRSTQLTTDGHYRLDTGGTAYGPVSVQTGDLARLPVAGLEGRTTEVFLKPSRGDFDQLPDTHTSAEYGDDCSARISYQPCWLHVPNT